MADFGTDVADLVAAERPVKKTAARGGTPVSSLIKSEPKVEDRKLKLPSLFKDIKPPDLVTNTATKALGFLMNPGDPRSIISGAQKSVIGGGKWLMEKAAEGIAGIATSDKFGGYNQKGADEMAAKVHQALEGINTAPKDKTEEAVMNFAGLLSEVPQKAGDSVFDHTGSALAATGAETLSTLLLLSPEIGGKILAKIPTPKGQPKASISSAFEELSATKPEVADAIAIHVGQVNPELSKVMKKQIKAAIKASDEKLTIIGRNSADAIMMEKNVPTTKGKIGPETRGADVARQEVEKHAEMLRRLNPEQVSSSIRTAVKEGQEAIQKSRMQAPESRSAAEHRTADGLFGYEIDPSKYGTLDLDTARSESPPPIERNSLEQEAAIQQRDKMEQDAHGLRGWGKEGAANEQPKATVTETTRTSDPEGKVVSIQDPGIVYFNSGIPVTREHIRAAFEFAGDLAKRVPGVLVAQGKMEELYKGAIETFNPEAKGPAARTAGAAIAKNFFLETAREHAIRQEGKKRRTYWQKMGEDVSMDFIKQSDAGKPFANPERELARQEYAKWMQRIVDQDTKTYAGSGKELPYDPLEHYVPRAFKDQEGVIRWANKKYGNKWYDPRFTKTRSFKLIQEALDAGFTLKTWNPEELMQGRQLASDIAAFRTDLLADLERKGVAVRAVKGAESPPAGYSPNSRRSPTGIRYWVKEELDPLMYNAFDSESLWNLKGSALKRGTSTVFRGWMHAKNALIPFKLAWSAFHPVHVTHIDAAAELTRSQELALGNPTAGNIAKALGKIVTGTPSSPVGVGGILYRAWWENPRMGWPLLRVFQGKKPFDSLNEGDKAAYRDMTEGGLILTRPKEETNSSIQRVLDGITERNLSTVFHLPNAIIEGVSYPIYNLWIPSLKGASYVKDVKVWRELNPEATPAQRQEAFRQIARRVESRYGEMDYRSRFMNKVTKDLGVMTNLSLGWNLGFLDQYAGGAVDMVKVVANRESLKSNIAEGRLSRPLFVANYVGTALTIGGLMTYWLANRIPSSFLDYTNPDSGEKDQYGKPIRLNTPFYTHEFSAISKHIEQEGAASGISKFLLAKGAGLWEMSQAAMTGINSLGDDIRNPKDPTYKQVEQTLAYELSEINSISLKAMNLAPGADAAKMRALAIGGFSPAGKYISQTAMEGQITDAYNRYERPKERPFQAVQMAKDVKELRQMFNADDVKYDAKLDTMRKAYDLDDKDIRRLEKMFNSPKEQEFDPSIFMFQHLRDWGTQKALLDKMTPEEQEKYLPHISKQKRAKYERETEE